MATDLPKKISSTEISTAFESPIWAEKFPPILSVDQAAQLLQVPKGTIYDWSSRGRLENCSFPAGRYLRFWRDRLVLQLFNGDR
jgi:excisionase family DNA binding protein